MLQVLAQVGQGRGGGGGGGGMPNIPWNLIVIALVLGWSGLMWVVRHLREQKRIRDQRQREAELQREALRTGRDPAQPPTPVMAPRMAPSPQQVSSADAQRELMERRQQQLRELRKKVAGQQPTPIPPRQPAQAFPSAPPVRPAPQQQPTGPVTVELWPGGPKVVVGQAGAPAPQRQPVAQAQRPAVPPQQQQQRQPKKNRQRAARPEPVEAPRGREIQPIQPLSARRGLDPAVAAIAADMPRTPQQWRTAIIAAEVLGPPMGLR